MRALLTAFVLYHFEAPTFFWVLYWIIFALITLSGIIEVSRKYSK